MVEYALMLVIFVGVMAVTAMIFGVWLVVILLRAVFRSVAAIFSTQSLPPMPMMGSRGMVCGNEKCKALNVESARFCRRCGGQLPQAQHVAARRVAMW